jgi:hypothetical protein
MDTVKPLPPGPLQTDPRQADLPSGANSQQAIKPWSIQSDTPEGAIQVVPPPHLDQPAPPQTSQAPTAGTSHAEEPRSAETKDDAFLALNSASTKFQTGVTQLDTARRQFASREYIESMHSSLSGIGNLVDAGGEAMEGLSTLAKLKGNEQWGKPFEQASNVLKSLGTPMRGAGDVFRDLDALLKTYSDPHASAGDIKLAFKAFLNSAARESGENLSTLNTTVGSANEFINHFATALQAHGNIGLGMSRILQNAGKLGMALRDGHEQKTAAAVAGTMAGIYFLGAGMTQAAAQALKAIGYYELGERIFHLGDATASYGEKYEALHERLEVNGHEK